MTEDEYFAEAKLLASTLRKRSINEDDIADMTPGMWTIVQDLAAIEFGVKRKVGFVDERMKLLVEALLMGPS